MKKHYRFVRKSYAMQRMARAIERAIDAQTSKETDRAIRWVAAWGLLCGIQTPGVRLRDSEVELESMVHARQPSAQIEVPSVTAYTLTEEMVANTKRRAPNCQQARRKRWTSTIRRQKTKASLQTDWNEAFSCKQFFSA